MEGRRVAWDTEAYLRRVRGACFLCELVRGTPGYEEHVIHRDDLVVAFLVRYPTVWGHTLVAPVEHREHAVGDFGEDEYLALQGAVHRVGRALTAVVETERLYVLSLGSQQGNRHVHWHLVPLPPGVPYDKQQTALFDEARGWQQFEPEDLATLAQSIAAALGPGLG